MSTYHDCRHLCCPQRSNPWHEHFLQPTECPGCARTAPCAPFSSTQPAEADGETPQTGERHL